MTVPLRLDPDPLRGTERRSFARAVTAMALTTGHRQPAKEVLRTNWRDDSQAERILKAATDPLDRSGFPIIQSTTVLPMLAPDAASTKLLMMGAQLSLDGIGTIALPFIGGAGRPTAAAFIAEGAPAPVVSLATSGAVLGPAGKICILSSLSFELQAASADTAAAVIGQTLAVSAEQAIDGALFSSNAATAIAPAGILHGVVPIPSTGEKGTPGLAGDLALLADAISKSGISIDDMIIVTTASLATKIRVLAGPKFQDAVLSSAMLAPGTLIGIVPRGLAAGYAGNVELATSIAAEVHMEDTAPLPIASGSPAVPAAPTLSAFQSCLIVLKVCARCAWCVQPGAVAVVMGADW
jgi:hypothetical protein